MDESTYTCCNKKMTVADARFELQQRGFKIVVDPNDKSSQHDIVTYEIGSNGNNNEYYRHECVNNILVAFDSRRVSFLSYRIDTMVFLFKITSDKKEMIYI
jgi:hypothetical protein